VDGGVQLVAFLTIPLVPSGFLRDCPIVVLVGEGFERAVAAVEPDCENRYVDLVTEVTGNSVSWDPTSLGIPLKK